MYNSGEIIFINFIYYVSISTHSSSVHQLVWAWISILKCYSVLKTFSPVQSMLTAVYSTFPPHHLPWDTTNLMSNVGWKEVHEQQISNKLADFQVHSSTWDTSSHGTDDVSSSCSLYRLPLYPVYQLPVYWSGHMTNLKMIWVHWSSTHHATSYQASITFYPVNRTRPSLPETNSSTVNPAHTETYEGRNFNSGNYLFTTDTK